MSKDARLFVRNVSSMIYESFYNDLSIAISERQQYCLYRFSENIELQNWFKTIPKYLKSELTHNVWNLLTLKKRN